MRLSDEQRREIKRLTAEIVGTDARVSLFGSRVDDSLRGGDVDLLVEAPRRLEARLALELRLGSRIERALGGRRVDVLLVDPTTPWQPVHHAAKSQGLPL